MRVSSLVLGVLLSWPGCRSERPMVWSMAKDGFEYSYFLGSTGPTYVRRKVRVDGCTFGDFPDDDGRPPLFEVACGVTWTATSGDSLTCTCLGESAR